MHKANDVFWKFVSDEFPTYFKDEILEFGSYNINGTIRDHFKDSKKYIGIDWRPGPCVDLVGLANEVKFDFKSKAVLSASMLEHDPFWRDSLDNMINCLKPDGILVLTWGSARNLVHCLVEAPDGKFHCLKADLVIQRLIDKGFDIHTSVYDGDLNQIKSLRELKIPMNSDLDGYGEFNLVALPSGSYTGQTDNGWISELKDEDKI